MNGKDAEGNPFIAIRENGSSYIDKTHLISEMLSRNDRGVYQIVRPRGFGKTTNLSMMDAFFNIRYEGNHWFDGLEISDHPEFDRFRNAFPVINLDMKDVRGDDKDLFYETMGEAVTAAFKEHEYILDSPVMRDYQRKRIERCLNGSSERFLLDLEIKNLCGLLEEHHGKHVVILIDEGYRMLSEGYGTEAFPKIAEYLDDMYCCLLKGNDYLQLGCIVGPAEIAKESIGTSFNNVIPDNIFSSHYDDAFGFTKDEAAEILSDHGHPEKIDEAILWYGGYRIGEKELINPSSLMGYISNGFVPGIYMDGAKNDRLIANPIADMYEDTCAGILRIISRGSVSMGDDIRVRYTEYGNPVNKLYRTMISAGCLRAVRTEDRWCIISIPNCEVSAVVDAIIDGLGPVDRHMYIEFRDAILEADETRAESVLKRIADGFADRTDDRPYYHTMAALVNALQKEYAITAKRDWYSEGTIIALKPKADGTSPLIIVFVKTTLEIQDQSAERKWMKDVGSSSELAPGTPLAVVSMPDRTPKVRITKSPMKSD